MAVVNTGKIYLGDTLLSGGGEKLKEFCQMNPLVKSYMENVTYNNSDYTVSNVGQYASQEATYNKYQPSGYVVDVESGMLHIADSNNGTMVENVVTGTKTIYNIVPLTGGIYTNVDSNENVVKAGKLRPTGSLRMLHVEGIKNVRDLGGWACDGGTVKYGKIIRGTTMNGSYTITEKGKNVLRNLIKIDHELDFRDDTEWAGTVSALGSDVAYTRIPYSMYYGAIVNVGMQEQFVKIFRTILDCVLNGEPIYIHCESGMDRCGTVCFLLESILGLSQSDIDKDYELSSFFTYPTTLKERNNEYYVAMVEAINVYEGSNRRDKVVNYLLTLGISIDEINAFRSAMIDGTPQTLTASVESYFVTNILTNATSDNNDTSVYEYQPYSANIEVASGKVIETVKVTMGGTDITDSVWKGTKTIRNRTVSKTLNNCTLSNNKKIVQEGQTYGTFVIPNEGYSLENISVTITMGGINVSNYYSDGAIVIPKVTGDITIEVKAVEQGVGYTNLAEPLPNNTTDTTKWVNGYRFGSSGISAQSGTTLSNIIGCTNGDIIRIKGVSLRESTDRMGVMATQITANGGYALAYFNNGIASGGETIVTYEGLVDGVYTFEINTGISFTVTGIRFAMPTPTDANAVIITVNEEIE